jgi:hypothetical protein
MVYHEFVSRTNRIVTDALAAVAAGVAPDLAFASSVQKNPAAAASVQTARRVFLALAYKGKLENAH